MTPFKVVIRVAILACAIALSAAGCATEQTPAPEQAATPVAMATATVPQAQASPAAQQPQAQAVPVEPANEEESGGALSTIGEILTAPFRLVASVVGFIL